MKCKYCGKDVNESMNFCSYCGSKIEHSEITDEEFELIKNLHTPAKICCAACGSDNIQFVSEYVQQKEKPPISGIGFIYTIATILLFIALPLLFISCAGTSAKGSESLLTIPGVTISLYLAGTSILLFVLTSVLKALQPYQNKTYLRAVCKDCGSSWRIRVEDKSLNKEKNEQ